MTKLETETAEEYARRILLTKIAENKGYRYDPKRGLSDAKSAQFVTDDENVIA